MSHCMPNSTTYKYPMSNYGEMYGDLSCTNTNHNSYWGCEGTSQHAHGQQDLEALRHMGIKNYIVTRSLDGQPVYKPIDEREYSCDCSLENPEAAHFNRNAYKHETRSARFRRGCDCHKRSGKDQCARPELQDRWRCYVPQAPRSATVRSQYDAHQHRRPGSPQHPHCSCGH